MIVILVSLFITKQNPNLVVCWTKITSGNEPSRVLRVDTTVTSFLSFKSLEYMHFILLGSFVLFCFVLCVFNSKWKRSQSNITILEFPDPRGVATIHSRHGVAEGLKMLFYVFPYCCSFLFSMAQRDPDLTCSWFRQLSN